MVQRTHEFLATREDRDALVRDLLDCSLIKAGEFVLHPECCNLVELCQQVLEAYTVGAGLALTFDSDLEAIEVSVDRERISQVLIHLGVPFFPLIRIDVPTYQADALPPELASIPAIKPGSRAAA